MLRIFSICNIWVELSFNKFIIVLVKVIELVDEDIVKILFILFSCLILEIILGSFVVMNL